MWNETDPIDSNYNIPSIKHNTRPTRLKQCIRHLISFNSTFQFNHQIQTIHTTRQTNLFYITRCKCYFASKLALYTFPQIWNKWFSTIPNNSSQAHTKHQLKTYFWSAYHSSVKCTYDYCNDCGSK